MTAAAALLCADSGSQRLLVAAVRDGAVLAQAGSVAHAAHGSSILDLCAEVTARAGLQPGAYAGLVVALGPGSFTGLRTALCTFKGLARGWGLPVVGVPTFFALARSVTGQPGARVVCCLDARKGEVYGGVVQLGDTPAGDEMAVAASVMPPAEFAARVQPLGRLPWAGDGPARFPAVIGAASDLPVAWPDAVPSPAALAACALARLPRGDDAALLEPCYVRRTVTELSLGPAPAPRA